MSDSIDYSTDAVDTRMDDSHRISIDELRRFVMTRMNSNTIDRLWNLLDGDGTGEIERNDPEILGVLQWMGVLFIAFQFRV